MRARFARSFQFRNQHHINTVFAENRIRIVFFEYEDDYQKCRESIIVVRNQHHINTVFAENRIRKKFF